MGHRETVPPDVPAVAPHRGVPQHAGGLGEDLLQLALAAGPGFLRRAQRRDVGDNPHQLPRLRAHGGDRSALPQPAGRRRLDHPKLLLVAGGAAADRLHRASVHRPAFRDVEILPQSVLARDRAVAEEAAVQPRRLHGKNPGGPPLIQADLGLPEQAIGLFEERMHPRRRRRCAGRRTPVQYEYSDRRHHGHPLHRNRGQPGHPVGVDPKADRHRGGEIRRQRKGTPRGGDGAGDRPRQCDPPKGFAGGGFHRRGLGKRANAPCPVVSRDKTRRGVLLDWRHPLSLRSVSLPIPSGSRPRPCPPARSDAFLRQAGIGFSQSRPS